MLHLAYALTRNEPYVVKFETCGDDIVVFSVWCLCLGCHYWYDGGKVIEASLSAKWLKNRSAG